MLSMLLSPQLTCQFHNPMKQKIIAAFLLLSAPFALAQGTFVIDQQSTNIIEGSEFLQSHAPLGQSFTPTLSSVDFVMLDLYDGDVFNNVGGTVYVNLRSNSITGTILGSSAAVFMSHDFSGVTNFSFSIPVAVTSGVTYYLEFVAEPGSEGFGSAVTDGSYPGGSAIANGVLIPGRDLWFQEGVIAVPEPSSALLVLVGTTVLIYARRKKY